MGNKKSTILIFLGLGTILAAEIFTFSYLWRFVASSFTKEDILIHISASGRLPIIPAFFPASFEIPIILLGISMIIIGLMTKLSKRLNKTNDLIDYV